MKPLTTQQLITLARIVVARGNLRAKRGREYSVTWSYGEIVVELSHDGSHWGITVARPGERPATVFSSHPFVCQSIRAGEALELFTQAYSATRAADRSRGVRLRVVAAA